MLKTKEIINVFAEIVPLWSLIVANCNNDRQK